MPVTVELQMRRRHAQVERAAQQHRQIELQDVVADQSIFIELLEEGAQHQRFFARVVREHDERIAVARLHDADGDHLTQIQVERGALQLLALLRTNELFDLDRILVVARRLDGFEVRCRISERRRLDVEEQRADGVFVVVAHTQNGTSSSPTSRTVFSTASLNVSAAGRSGFCFEACGGFTRRPSMSCPWNSTSVAYSLILTPTHSSVSALPAIWMIRLAFVRLSTSPFSWPRKYTTGFISRFWPTGSYAISRMMTTGSLPFRSAALSHFEGK